MTYNWFPSCPYGIAPSAPLPSQKYPVLLVELYDYPACIRYFFGWGEGELYVL